MTNESPSPSEDLEPARAIRRALALAGFKARDVGLIAVWANEPGARATAEQAITRGLGRFAAGATAVVDDPDPFARCYAAIESGTAAVAVGAVIDPAGGTRALAFGRSR